MRENTMNIDIDKIREKYGRDERLTYEEFTELAKWNDEPADPDDTSFVEYVEDSYKIYVTKFDETRRPEEPNVPEAAESKTPKTLKFHAKLIDKHERPNRYGENDGRKVVNNWDVYCSSEHVGNIIEFGTENDCKNTFHEATLYSFVSSDCRQRMSYHQFDAAYAWIQGTIQDIVLPLFESN